MVRHAAGAFSPELSGPSALGCCPVAVWAEVMNLADAYPNSALPVGALLAIALTMAVVLVIWLIMVFRADSQPKADSRPKADSEPKVAEPAATSEDKHNDPGHAQADSREGASA